MSQMGVDQILFQNPKAAKNPQSKNDGRSEVEKGDLNGELELGVTLFS